MRLVQARRLIQLPTVVDEGIGRGYTLGSGQLSVKVFCFPGKPNKVRMRSVLFCQKLDDDNAQVVPFV